MKKYKILWGNTPKFRTFLVVSAFFKAWRGRFEIIKHVVITNCENSKKWNVIGIGGQRAPHPNYRSWGKSVTPQPKKKEDRAAPHPHPAPHNI